MDDSALAAEIAAVPHIQLFDVFSAAPWFPQLRALPTARLLQLDEAWTTPATAVPRAAVLLELVQRYASATPAVFEADVPNAAVRARVLDWWKTAFESAQSRSASSRTPEETRERAVEAARLQLATALAAKDAAAEDAAVNALITAELTPDASYDDEDAIDLSLGRLKPPPTDPLLPSALWAHPPSLDTNRGFHRFSFGYDPQSPPTPFGRTLEMAVRGDMDHLLRQPGRLYCPPEPGFVDARTMAETSLLEAVWAANALKEVAIGIGQFGHVHLLERLVAETRAPLLGTPRHRGRLARRGEALLQHAIGAAINSRRVDMLQRLIALAPGIALPNPYIPLHAAATWGDVALVEQILGLLPPVHTAEEVAQRKAQLTRMATVALHRPYPDVLPPLYRAGADAWEIVDRLRGWDATFSIYDRPEGRVAPASLVLAYAHAGGWGPMKLENLVEELDADGLRWALAHDIPVGDKAKAVEMLASVTFPTPRTLACIKVLVEEADFPVSAEALAEAAGHFALPHFAVLAGVWLRTQATLPTASIIQAIARRAYLGRDIAAFLATMQDKWGVELDEQALCKLVEGRAEAGSAVIPSVQQRRSSLATANVFAAAIKASSIPLIHCLLQLGVAWPATAMKTANALSGWQRRGPLLSYLAHHQCPGAEAVAASELAAEAAPSAQAAKAIQEEADMDAASHVLWPVRDKLATLFSPAYGFTYSPQPEFSVTSLVALPLGTSRIGGLPDLPPALPWPTCDGRPLRFMVQLNLGEIVTTPNRDPSADTPAAGLDDRALLPRQGWLWFFADLADSELFGGESEKGQALLFWDGPVTELQRRRNPADAELDEADLAEFGTGLSAHALKPAHIVTPHPMDPTPPGFTDAEENAVLDLLRSEGDGTLVVRSDVASEAPWTARYSKGGLQLLGHPSLIQSDIFGGYIPHIIVRRFAGLDAIPEEDLGEADEAGEDGGAGKDEDEDEDEGAGKDEDDADNPDHGDVDDDGHDEEGSDEDESAEITGGAAKDVLRTVRRHNRRLAQGIASEIRDELSKEWLLLLQLPSLWDVRTFDAANEFIFEGEVMETDLVMGDVGTLYVCIRRSDLVARRFDKTFTVFQCS